MVLSMMARVYDPLGLISPIILVPKILIQRIWQSGATWDEPLPDHLLVK